MKKREDIQFYGHPLIKATHRKTFEITKDEDISIRGDCIIGVRATKACRDLNDEIKRILSQAARVEIKVVVGGSVFHTSAYGSPFITLTHPLDIVVRRSSFICPRTLAINSDKAASDMPRSMVKMLQNSSTSGSMIVEASLT